MLSALGADGASEAVARLAELATDDGWEQPWMAPPRFPPHTRINDATLGTAGNLLGAVWAHRHGTPGAAELAHRTADLLLAEGEPTEAGTNWPFVPRRFTEAVRAERGDSRCPTGRTGWPGSPPRSPSPVSSSTARTWWTRRAAARSTSSPSVTRATAASWCPT